MTIFATSMIFIFPLLSQICPEHFCRDLDITAEFGLYHIRRRRIIVHSLYKVRQYVGLLSVLSRQRREFHRFHDVCPVPSGTGVARDVATTRDFLCLPDAGSASIRIVGNLGFAQISVHLIWEDLRKPFSKGVRNFKIPFATHAFASQCRICPSRLLSPLVFHLISTDFTPTPGVPPASDIPK